jgi:hypothetical protein
MKPRFELGNRSRLGKTSSARSSSNPRRAAERQKRGRGGGRPCYKQTTPTGFQMRSISSIDLGASKMWAMTNPKEERETLPRLGQLCLRPGNQGENGPGRKPYGE